MICAPPFEASRSEIVPLAAEAVANPPCAWLRLDLAGRAGLAFPDVGISRTLTLPRAHAEGGLAFDDWAAARLGVAVVRSGGEAGYVGVDGEALVPEVQVAEARGGYAPWGLGIGAGVVDDPWVATGDAAWGLRDLSPTLGEAVGWMDSSDVGGWVGWTGPGRTAAARVDLTAGEGARYRERNEGKDLAGTVIVRPFPAAPERLVVTAFVRDGSRGLGLARDHRAGVRVSGGGGPVSLGAEGLAAWGVGGDATRQPIGGSAWGTVRPWGPLLAVARLDLTTEAMGAPDAGTSVLLVASGVELPGGTLHPLRVVAGYSRTRVGSAVAQVAGASALEDGDALFLQVGVSLAASGR